MTDVTIHPDNAKRFAAYLRGTTTVGYYPWVHELADLLDPPPATLLDDLLAVLQAGIGKPRDVHAGLLLDVVRQHLDKLPRYTRITGQDPDRPAASNVCIDMQDIARMLGDLRD